MQNYKLKLKIKNHLTIALVAVFFLFISKSSLAAEMSFSPQKFEVKNGELFEAGFYLNAENDSINALEGKIIFPSDILKLRQIKDGNSIINFWVEKPNSANIGQIIFSGIIPGGYKQEKGLIFSLIFEAEKDGKADIGIAEASTLRNDGLGTKVKLKVKQASVVVLKNDRKAETETERSKTLLKELNYENDRNPPEEFTPAISQDANIFDGKYFIVFKTDDKQSGVDYYEVKETKKRRAGSRDWVKTESPYVLKDQSLKSFVYVKAVDRAGNEKIASIAPIHKASFYENYLLWFIIIILILLIYFFRKRVGFLKFKK